MGALEIPGLIALIVILAILIGIVVAGIVYTVRIARSGPEATLARATRRPNL